MEIGWDMDIAFGQHVPQEIKAKKRAAETKYVESFVVTQAKSPFVRPRPVEAEIKK